MLVAVTAIDYHRPAGDGLPLYVPVAVPGRGPVLLAAPRVVEDLARDLGGAAAAVRAMPSVGGADVTVAAHTAVVCTAVTAAGAFSRPPTGAARPSGPRSAPWPWPGCPATARTSGSSA
ncbi:hypothetical protein ACFQ0M_00110 [Kitasatospora aburaviensis]